VFAVWDQPLSVDAALAAVRHPGAGGIVLFLGVVREQNEGHAVTHLDYEAYASMAVAEMQRLGDAITGTVPGVRLAALHRTGRLAVGDLAVVCAASAPHRDEAFRACRQLIDGIKQRVPVWKREEGPDGACWIGWEGAGS
jgi:molybdopterin synthase catalytic subunit